MGDNKNKSHSYESLFKLLKDADLPDGQKLMLDGLIKYGAVAEDQLLQGVISDFLLCSRALNYGFGGPPDDSGGVIFDLGSHIAIYGQPRTGKSMLIMQEVARLAREGAK